MGISSSPARINRLYTAAQAVTGTPIGSAVICFVEKTFCKYVLSITQIKNKDKKRFDVDLVLNSNC
jgi:hypothetical protein